MKSSDDETRSRSKNNYDRVQSQFGAASAAYTTSAGLSDRAMLLSVVNLACPEQADRVLDVATGAGHTALALAPHVAQVVAYDVTEQMLEETARNAADRGLHNILIKQGIAENLAFPDASFEIVTVRLAPHHFSDIQAAVREMARVLKPHGRLVIVDSRAPEDDEIDEAYNHIEKLRDPSHVRNYRPSEWRAMIRDAGLRILSEELDYYTEDGKAMDFATWTSRMKTPPEAVAELRKLFQSASPALIEAIKIEIVDDKIGFCVPQITIVATKD